MTSKKHPSSRAAALAALFATVQFVAACGGSDNNDPAPAPPPVAAPSPAPTPAQPTTVSPLKTLLYSVQREDDGSAFSGAGQVSDPTPSGATLSLGAAGTVVLTVDTANNGFVITTPDYAVVSRFGGSVLMLCDATDTPGTSTARFVAVADRVAQGGVAPEAVTDAAALAGLRLFKMSNCSYQSGGGAQGQNAAADADSLYLEFDAGGNTVSNATATTYTAAQFSALLAGGSSMAGSRFAAYRFTVDGQASIVLVERGDYDAANGVPGYVRLWLPQ